jgi:single-strand DNA-binding protein
MGVNSITLVGRAGRDPEVRYFESGSMVANLTMAVNRRSRDEEPDWFNLEIWGKQAQVAADYVRKGTLLGIIGSFKLDRWTDRSSGEERTKPVIRVDRLELLGSKRDADQGGAGFGGGGYGGGEPSEEEVPFYGVPLTGGAQLRAERRFQRRKPTAPMATSRARLPLDSVLMV